VSGELSRFVGVLLAAERSAPPVEGDVRARLRQRLTGGPERSWLDESADTASRSLGGGVAAHALAHERAAPARRYFGSTGLAVAVASALAAGVVLGAGGYALLRERSPASRADRDSAAEVASVPPARPAQVVGSSSAGAPSAAAGAAGGEPEDPTAPAGGAVRPGRRDRDLDRDRDVGRGGDDDLDHERDLLEAARTALGRGDAAGALRQLGLHVVRYPAGRLVEEREALRVEALAAAGDRERARAAALEFRRRFPASLFGPAVLRASETQP
jgi:hypothetical protein